MKPHICVLNLINESNLGMGRQLLCECLIGEINDRTKKLRLNKLVHFESLPLYDKKDIFEIVDLLVYKKFLEFVPVKSNKFMKVLSITKKGLVELDNPTEKLKIEKSFESYYSNIQKVTDKDKIIFNQLKDILKGLSDEQKKAVICDNKNILCIAGAGSGKTRVLTTRAWFLSKYKSVKNILCVTFTRKARIEMIERLERKYPNHNIEVETFNSFCEKILRKNETLIYQKKTTVIDYKTKISLINKILKEMNISTDYVLNLYYTKRKIYSSDRRTLYLGFINDIFSLLDYQRNNYILDLELDKLIQDHYDYNLSKLFMEIISKIKLLKNQEGLRDFTDQISHVIRFFKDNTQNIPKYDHILIDEYQDINSLQFELINLLNVECIFAVGDPRQSIYGWRSSKIEFILDFENLFKNSAILQLSTNYRSHKKIVNACNYVIKSMKLPDLTINKEDDGDVKLIKHKNEDAESIFISQSIKSLDINKNKIFVLARTNRQIERIAEQCNINSIKYIKRTIQEQKINIEAKDNEITLSTIHAIKGLEADIVYVIGVNTKNLPCKATEHPILEAVKINDTYDKYEEERRLLYVAMSRAKEKLIINYSGTITSFIDENLIEQLSNKKTKFTSQEPQAIKYKINSNMDSGLFEELKNYRYEKSKLLNVPAYQIFSDKTLTELTEVMPTSFEELQEINGFGPFKVKKYGDDIVQLIINHS